ncbi:hypothetical protein GCM10010193_23500 [Kitasatospora atroaurantiaca]
MPWRRSLRSRSSLADCARRFFATSTEPYHRAEAREALVAWDYDIADLETAEASRIRARLPSFDAEPQALLRTEISDCPSVLLISKSGLDGWSESVEPQVRPHCQCPLVVWKQRWRGRRKGVERVSEKG